tara:strand:+ start:736 stop:981 length:246 start_codon:yes stop_codon:yes gene_type:complete
VAKKNSKKNRQKSKDRFRNSIITSNPTVSTNIKPDTITEIGSIASNSVASTKVKSLGTELKFIGVIGSTLFVILIITFFII